MKKMSAVLVALLFAGSAVAAQAPAPDKNIDSDMVLKTYKPKTKPRI